MAEDIEPRARHNETQSTRPPVLTEADVRMLARAIKAGTAPDRPSLSETLFDALTLVLAAGFLAGSWVVLHSWRPAVEASYRGNVTNTLTTLSLGTAQSGVSWSLPMAYAQTVKLSGPATTEGRLILAIARTACDQIARGLGLACDGGVIATPASISVRWSSPQLVYLAPLAARPYQAALGQAKTVVVGISQFATNDQAGSTPAPAGGQSGKDLSIDLRGSGPISWCTPLTNSAARLTVSNGPQSYQVPEDDFVDDTSCSHGLVVAVQALGSGGAAGIPPRTDLVDVSPLGFQAWAASVDAGDLGGRLNLVSAGTDNLALPAEVRLGAGSSDIQVGLDFSADGTEQATISSRLNQVASGGPNLVTSWWDREGAIAVPIFLALCGIFFNLVFHLFDDLRRMWIVGARRETLKQ